MSHVILATGDLAPDRDDYDESYAETRDELHRADVVFGQLETSFALSGTRLPQARHAVLARPEGAAAMRGGSMGWVIHRSLPLSSMTFRWMDSTCASWVEVKTDHPEEVRFSKITWSARLRTRPARTT